MSDDRNDVVGNSDRIEVWKRRSGNWKTLYRPLDWRVENE